MEPVDKLVSRLDGVRQTGERQWMAKCPAHADKSPSLSVKECDGGRALLHCFAGCETEDVLAAVGLSFSDLFTDRPLSHHQSSIRHKLPARDALVLLDHETLVVAIIGADFLAHKQVDEPTWLRLAQAISRINEVRAMVAPARAVR